jgi:PAS domain S-box-containing protein
MNNDNLLRLKELTDLLLGYKEADRNKTPIIDAEDLQIIVKNAPDAIIVANVTGEIILCNKEATAVFGYEENELLEKNVSILAPSPYSEEHDNYIKEYMKTGVKRILGVRRSVKGRRKNGSVFPMYLVVNEVNTASTTYFIAIVVDLTEPIITLNN